MNRRIARKVANASGMYTIKMGLHWWMCGHKGAAVKKAIALSGWEPYKKVRRR